ncbi:MAG TPA: SRPBCC family protein [Aquihabitans sp.]|nr:SRPBCC family protein [Aquihabitans sp.]
MSIVRHTINKPVADVWEALTTPETYPHWLVGCRDIRAVDDGWPAVGTAFHHRIGIAGPLTVADLSKVLEIEAPRRLSLEVRARPLGRGRAAFTLSEGTGSGGPSTVVALDEVPIGLLAPTKPVVDPLTAARNRKSLANLADYLEHGRSHASPPL